MVIVLYFQASAEGDIRVRKGERMVLGVSPQADVAVRILLCLAGHAGETATEKIQRAEGLYTFQLDEGIRLLERAGLIEVRGDACRLCCAPETLTLYEVMRAVQGEVEVAQCMGNDGYCPWRTQECCAVRRMLAPVQENIIRELAAWSLERLAKEGRRLRERCILQE